MNEAVRDMGSRMTFTRLTVGEATEEDYPHIAALHARSWQVHYGAELPEERLHGDIQDSLLEKWLAYTPQAGKLLLTARAATGDEALLGFCAVLPKPDPYVDNLHVSPAAQRQGVGRALLAETASRLLVAGETYLSLTVLKSNARARAFYVALGGVEGAEMTEMLYGVEVRTIPVAWTDVSALERLSGGRT